MRSGAASSPATHPLRHPGLPPVVSIEKADTRRQSGRLSGHGRRRGRDCAVPEGLFDRNSAREFRGSGRASRRAADARRFGEQAPETPRRTQNGNATPNAVEQLDRAVPSIQPHPVPRVARVLRKPAASRRVRRGIELTRGVASARPFTSMRGASMNPRTRSRYDRGEATRSSYRHMRTRSHRSRRQTKPERQIIFARVRSPAKSRRDKSVLRRFGALLQTTRWRSIAIRSVTPGSRPSCDSSVVIWPR
jgi:hypothetical protein